MINKRSIMIVTGTRADYGLLRHVIREIHSHKELELRLVVTGTHLDPSHNTIKEIEADGFPIYLKLPILSGDTTQNGIANAMARTLNGLSETLTRSKPDIMIILGDRYEMFAAVSTALLHNVPVAHLHGGELTLGAIDDAFRHSMTKMSWWHFTSTEDYRKRVIQLGEDPSRVFNVGATAMDSLEDSKLTKDELEKFLGIQLISPVILATLHPETQSPGKAREHVGIVWEGIKRSRPGTVIFTRANADAEGEEINSFLEEKIGAKDIPNSVLVSSLGQKRYLSLLRLADAGVGNSSSLVIEGPMVKTPSVNIGLRQAGRLRFLSILDVEFDPDSILKAIKEVVHPEFKDKFRELSHPFGTFGVGSRIVDILSKAELPSNLIKGFYE